MKNIIGFLRERFVKGLKGWKQELSFLDNVEMPAIDVDEQIAEFRLERD